MHDAERAALLAGAVVGEEHEQGVVELAEALETVEEPTELHVGVVEERRERLLQPRCELAVRLGHGRPLLDARVAGREFGVGRDETHLDLAGEPTLARHVPTLVEATAVLLEVLRRCLVRGMHRAECQVHEERTVGPDRDGVVDESEGVVDEVLGEVVPLLGTLRRLHHVVVVDEFGVELIGLALHEPVEAVEPALAGPLVVRAGRRRVLHGAQVPLAHGEGRVALVAEHLGRRGGVVRHVPAHVGVPAREVRHRPHTHLVMVAPRQQRGTARRAQRRDVEVGVPEPVRREPVDVRGRHVRAEAPELGEAGVVEQDHHDVGRLVTRMGRRGPPRGRLGLGAADGAAELLVVQHVVPFVAAFGWEMLREFVGAAG